MLAFDVSPTAAMSILGSESIDERHVSCKAYTCASLRNVKRVGFSTGSTGSPRLENEISGLWIDHFALHPSGIAGQWLSETDSFTLSEGERVIEVIIWTSEVEISATEYCPFGRVLRMSMLTSNGRSKTVPSDGPSPLNDWDVWTYRENRCEELVSGAHTCALQQQLIRVFLVFIPVDVQRVRLSSHHLPFQSPSDPPASMVSRILRQFI